MQPTTTSSSSGCGITDTSVGPASVMVGNLVQGNRLAVAQGRDIGLSEDSEKKVILSFLLLKTTTIIYYLTYLASSDYSGA